MNLVTLISGFVTLSCLGDTQDRPPPLTFDQQVDYVAWCNELLSRGKAENAFPLYEPLSPDESGQGGFRPPEGVAKEQADQIGFSVWDARDYPDLAAYLNESAPQFETLRKAARIKDFWQPLHEDAGPLIFREVPALRPSWPLSRMIILRAWMKQEDQAEAMMDAHRIVLRNARHMQQSGIFIGGMIGIADRAQVYKSTVAAVANHTITGKNLKKSYLILKKQDPGSPDWRRISMLTWATLLDALQSLCPGGKFDEVRWKEFKETFSASARGGPLPDDEGFDPQEANTLIELHAVQLQRILSKPIGLQQRDEVRRHDKRVAPAMKRNAFTRILAPVLSYACERTLRSEAYRRGTMLILAIHAHHAKHGKWPKSLKKIDKKLRLKGLKKLRRDPYSGKYFKYRIEDGEPLLYSVAGDGEDNGGVHDPKWGEDGQGGDYVFWPRQSE